MTEFTFKLPDMEEPETYVMLPRSKAFHIAYYPKFQVEFYDLVKDCAQYIDKLHKVEDKILYTNHLSRIFIVRHKGEAMKLFKKLVTLYMKEKGR